jgi:Ca-activated chloride channel family protein
MKTSHATPSLLLLLSLAGCRMSCSAHSPSLSLHEELSAGLESPYVLATGDGTSMLGIALRPRDEAASRSPVALALVIDNSGSMQGEKIEFARSASRAIVEAVADGDEVSLIEFSDDAKTLVPLVRVDTTTRQRLRAAIDTIDATSGTAIHAGLQAGLRSLTAAHCASRRLILVSDGHANVGPATATEIVAGLASPSPVTLSTIGVGTDYDEDVLTAISQHGAGGFHHLNDPVQLAQILADELKQAHAVIGTNAAVDITCGPGVQILDAGGVALQRLANGRVHIAVGDLYAGDRRTLMLPIKVPVAGSSAGAVGNVQLSYQPSDGRAPRMSQVDVRYTVTASPVEVARGLVPELEVAADRTRVAHVLGDAAALLKAGDLIEAQTILRDERGRLQARVDKLAGLERAEAEQLVAMLRDPYVDASPAVSPAHARLAPDRFAALVETARQGRLIVEADLAALDRSQLRLLRNVPYARHGYAFNSDDLRREFSTMSWYRANPRFDNALFDRVDADNIALVHSYEGRAQLLAARPSNAAKDPVAARTRFESSLQRARNGELLPAGDLDALDLGELRLLRNTSYARHGYVFRASDLQAAFASKPWYRANPGYREANLSSQDSHNIALVQERERTLLAGIGGEALRDFELRSRALSWKAAHQ